MWTNRKRDGVKKGRKQASKEGREREREREREDPPTSHTSSNMLSVFCTREFSFLSEVPLPLPSSGHNIKPKIIICWPCLLLRQRILCLDSL